MARRKPAHVVDFAREGEAVEDAQSLWPDPEQEPFFRALEEMLEPEDIIALGRRLLAIERNREILRGPCRALDTRLHRNARIGPRCTIRAAEGRRPKASAAAS